MRYIIVTGGALSGLGKGLTTASVAKILQSKGYSIVPIKIDPYVNIYAGTMSPFEHGEVFVLDDGGEVDLDLGNYERFLGLSLSRSHNITTGKVYQNVIQKERKGDYLGKTVQIIPHVTNEIKEQIRQNSNDHDFIIIEVGGTVGDIESMPFLEAVRQIANEEDTVFIHVVPILKMGVVGEQKTKPAQKSVKDLMEAGIKPDMLVCRTNEHLTPEVKDKLSLFCNIKKDFVIENMDVDDIYTIPLYLNDQKVGEKIINRFGLDGKVDLGKWKEIIGVQTKGTVKIALVGKYTKLHDSYISLKEALKHASYKTGYQVCIDWIGADDIDEDSLREYDGILVPGGFGPRGSEGKIEAIKIARESKMPFLGLCYGFQLAVVEYARHCGIRDAVSKEFEKEGTMVIDLLESQKNLVNMGASMRLGSSKVIIKDGTTAKKLYKKSSITERHRHRLEVNHEHIPLMEDNGIVFSGESPDGRMEILELPDHPFFFATQFHPEFKSKVECPAPAFVGFVDACSKYMEKRN